MTNSNPIEILLIEDNEGDAKLTEKALKKAKIVNRLHVVDDGSKGMDFLGQRGEYSEVPRPDLILLDLNPPKKDGREVLDEVKHDLTFSEYPWLS